MEFGAAVHAALEAIGWLDANTEIPAHPDPEVEKARTRCLAVPSVRAIFTRPPGEVDLWREQPFDVLDGAHWTSGIMDRVHIHRENGRAVRAVVIDYKTDTVEAVEVLVEKYQGQMQSYRASLARIMGIEPSSIQCIVISTHLAQTIEIPPA